MKKLLLLIILIPILSFSQDAWTQLEDFPEIGSGRANFVVSGEAYVVVSPELTATSPKSLYKFDASTETFEFLDTFPDIGFNGQLQFDDRLFFVRAEQNDNGTTFTAIEYFPESNELTERSSIEVSEVLSIAGPWISAHVYDELGYILTNGEGDNTFTYNPEQDIWTNTGRVEFPFCYAPGASMLIQEKVYLIYEEDCEGERSNEVWQYSLLTKELEQKDNIPGGDNYSPKSFVINDLGYLGMGEIIPGIVTSGFMRYYPETDDWEVISACGYAATAPFTFVLNDLAYIGTGNDPGLFPEYVDEVWRLDPELLSVETVDKVAITLYPNPTSDVLAINGLLESDKVVLYDSLGKKIDVTLSRKQIETSSLPSGLYFLQISNLKGNQTFKFIKQ